MIYKPYDLSFLFDPIGSATGFLIPVFLEQGSVDKFAVQIIGRDGIVSSFSRVELEDAADLISTKNPCLSGYHPHPLYVVCLLGLQARAGAGALRRRSG